MSVTKAELKRLGGQLERLARDLRTFLATPDESSERAERLGRHRGAIQRAATELELLAKDVQP